MPFPRTCSGFPPITSVWIRSEIVVRPTVRHLTARAGVGRLPGGMALAILLGACATSPVPPAGLGDAAIDTRSAREQVVATALAQVGTPYRFGGETPRGFDCSGLVRFAHDAAGIPVPRQTNVQANGARTADPARLEPGDLLFFRIENDKPEHVSIYVGDNRFVHAPSSGGHVQVVRLDHPYWAPRLLHAGHYFPD